MRRIFLTAAALMLFYFSVLMPIHPLAMAQSESSSRIMELERRANLMDTEHFGERLARVEATIDTNNKLLMGIFIAMILMLVERAAQIGKRRKSGQE